MSATTPIPPRAWQRMLSGRRLDLLNPSPDDIDIEDIAHGLARVARWNGQTLGAHALSVAQHVVLVESIACNRNPTWPAGWCLAALLHDAAEYVIGDLISPFKTAIGLDYRAFEQRLMSAIHQRFGLPGELPDDVEQEIKNSDRIAAYYEATLLAGFTVEEAERYFSRPQLVASQQRRELESLVSWSTDIAQQKFLARYCELKKRMTDLP